MIPSNFSSSNVLWDLDIETFTSCNTFEHAFIILDSLQYVPWTCKRLLRPPLLGSPSLKCSLVCESMHYATSGGELLL